MGVLMCGCKSCGVQVGIKTGLSGLGHLANIALVFLTGLLWLVPYIIIMACSGSIRCTKCGGKSKKL